MARSKSGLTQEQLADRLHVSTSLIAKFETNRLIPKQDTAQQLDAALDSGTAIQEEAAEVRSLFGAMEFIRHWLEFEQQAGMIRSFNPLVVPGLLQTEAYARALLSEAGTRVPDIDESVSDRLERAGILRREDNPCRLVVVVDEAVLRRPVGGPKVMAEQLISITEACSLPTISVAVVPSSVGAYPGVNGPLSIASVDGRNVGIVDEPLGANVVEDPEQVLSLEGVWEAIRGYALPERLSLELITEVAESWT